MKMTEALNNYFSQLLNKTDGLLAILVTDRDGVPIIKLNGGKCPEAAARGSFLATFATATEQASKLGLSKNKTMICMYLSYQVIMFNYTPLVVTMVASSTANTGMILSMERDFKDVMEELQKSVEVP